jgi:hypothetical protein
MQLLVPQSVRSSISAAGNITISSLGTSDLGTTKTSWPALQGVTSSSDRTEGIAFTGNEDPQAINAMLKLLTDQIDNAGQSSMIVFSEEPIPASLLSQLPQSLHSLIRRPLHHDLFYLPTVSDELVASKAGLLDIVVQNSPFCVAISKAPAIERFPLAGPGRSVIRIDSLTTAIERPCRHWRQITETNAASNPVCCCFGIFWMSPMRSPRPWKARAHQEPQTTGTASCTAASPTLAMRPTGFVESARIRRWIISVRN